MIKYTLLLMMFFVHLYAQNIDKKKILEIIKAAKKHKSVSMTDKRDIAKKETVSETKPIIVYRKKMHPVVYKKNNVKTQRQLSSISYGALPTLAPSSIELRRKFYMKKKEKKILFQSPQQTRDNKINTQAKKIKYF